MRPEPGLPHGRRPAAGARAPQLGCRPGRTGPRLSVRAGPALPRHALIRPNREDPWLMTVAIALFTADLRPYDDPVLRGAPGGSTPTRASWPRRARRRLWVRSTSGSSPPISVAGAVWGCAAR